MAADKILAMREQQDQSVLSSKGNGSRVDVELASTDVDIDRIEKVYR